MATRYWVGRASAIKQITTITVANTWAAADTCTVKINEKELVITCGSTTTTTATVAAAIKEAFMAPDRLDGTSASSNATSNAGGQQWGEFREITASVSGSVVTLIGNTAGKPFTVTVTEVTGGTGTATGSTTQTATGPNYWDNVDNWIDSLDLTTGSTGVPANDDTVDFRNSSIPCKYGLPNGSLEVTMLVWKSYSEGGEIGLPYINRDNGTGYEYPEYRQRYVRLDDAGTGTNIAHRFGLGQDGTGCRLCNLKHSTLKCSPIVYSTGTPLAERVGEKALNICCTANTSTLNILGGSVDWSSQDGGTSAFLQVKQTGGDSIGINAIHTTNGQAQLTAGTMVFGGTGAVSLVACYGGEMRIENQTGTITTVNIYGGVVRYISTATISQLSIWRNGGEFNAADDAGAVTITNADFYPPFKIKDPYRRITWSNAFSVYGDPNSDWNFGATDNNYLTVNLA